MQSHVRRPSRAERFEATVDSARHLLRRTQQQHEARAQHVGLGIATDSGESSSNTGVSRDELAEALSSLLKVIDGMVSTGYEG